MKYISQKIKDDAFEAGFEMFMALDEAPKDTYDAILEDFDIFRKGTSLYDIWFWIESRYGDNEMFGERT